MPITLYTKPNACSLAIHLALKVAKLDYKVVAVDLATKKTSAGEDYLSINPTGAVPAIKLENGEILTQNLAIQHYIGAISKHSSFYFPDPVKDARLLEALAFCGDFHAGVGGHLFGKGPEAGYTRRFAEFEKIFPNGGYWLGTSEPSQADLYAAVIINWAIAFGKDISAYPKAAALHKKVFESQYAKEALKEQDSA